MIHKPSVCRRVSESGAEQCGWHLISPELLEKARTRVQLIAWLMLGVMALGAFVDFVWAGFFMGEEVRQSINVVWIASTVFVLAITVGLLLASYSKRLTHVTVLHLALAYEVVTCLFMSTSMANSEWKIDRGECYLFWGSETGFPAAVSASEADVTIRLNDVSEETYKEAYALFAFTKTFSGETDFDGDGLADLFVGSIMDDQGGTDGGAVYYFAAADDFTDNDCCAEDPVDDDTSSDDDGGPDDDGDQDDDSVMDDDSAGDDDSVPEGSCAKTCSCSSACEEARTEPAGFVSRVLSAFLSR